MVADALDGRVARALHTAGPMGVELDSLSDDISFGIAAGALIYSYQLHELGWVGIIPCALLGTFCAFRLARFNVRSHPFMAISKDCLPDDRRHHFRLRALRCESLELAYRPLGPSARLPHGE